MMAVHLHHAGLTENCRDCATESLNFLKDLKTKATLQRADPAAVRLIVQKILYLGQVRDWGCGNGGKLADLNCVNKYLY